MGKIKLSPSVLTWVRSFEAVVRCRSFTKAAEDLCITQGAVSQQVRQLEAWLKKPLLQRTSKLLTPTPEGRGLAAVLNESLGAIEDALCQIRSPDVEQALLLSCSPSFAIGWLTPRLGDFYRAHPQVGLRVLGEFHSVNEARMITEGLAAAVRFDLGHYQDLMSTSILDEYLIPVTSPGYMAAHPEIRSPADLKGEHLLHDAQPWVGAEPYEEWSLWLEHAKVTIPAVQMSQGHRFNLSQLAVAAAKADQGIAMGRLALVLDDVREGRLCIPFRQYVVSRASYFLVTLPRLHHQVDVVSHWLMRHAEVFRHQRAQVLSDMALI
jgi:LysR family transcriptional regulator, glycine cleavage system transcriptional activator